MVNNTACYSSPPITVQACLRVRKLALHSNRSYGYAFRSRAALTNTNPAPAPVILVRNAGWIQCEKKPGDASPGSVFCSNRYLATATVQATW